MLPITALAAYEDGTECEFCGSYRYDDWLCDCGPHCSDNADGDCYEIHHCPNCQEINDNCDECYLCEDCQQHSEFHCLWCGEHESDICDECLACDNCEVNVGYHCTACGECIVTAGECGVHPTEAGEENHCEQCALVCNDCGYCFWEYADIFCEDCVMCYTCAQVNHYHCNECYGCYVGEICEECEFCPECAVDFGLHCSICGVHTDDWCEDGGEGTHCADCALEISCEQCGSCSECTGLEFCEECGLCPECCRDNAAEYGCSCGEYCVESGDFEEHFCEDCGTCYDEVEPCETCGFCLECCESTTDCSEGLCIEDSDYEEHFCEECGQCFHESEACESCVDAGERICQECCEQKTSDSSTCEHNLCMNSWEWDEHYCEECDMCYAQCEHEAELHTHNYNASNVCTICSAHKNGVPVIIREPENVECSVMSEEIDGAAFYENHVSFTVKAVGDGLTYQWYNARTNKKINDSKYKYNGTEYVIFEGTETDTLKVIVNTSACTNPGMFYCIVSNAKGDVISKTVRIIASHSHRVFVSDEMGHYKKCVACDASLVKEPHCFSGWQVEAAATTKKEGSRKRSCMDCGYSETQVIAKLEETHVHDYSYEYKSNVEFHWGQCECGHEEKTNPQVHTFCEWTVTKNATTTAKGEEKRTCSVCGYSETRETERKGHTHMFYNWDYIMEHGYIVEGGEEVYPYEGEYGKTDKNYHYAYCLEEGCDEVEKTCHKWGGVKWIAYPTETSDGVFYKTCGTCNYEIGKTVSARQYQIITDGCNVSAQNASPGATIKIYPYSDYSENKYFEGEFDVTYTEDGGGYGNWKTIPVEHHLPEDEKDKEYWYFKMPKPSEGVRWQSFWVEVTAVLYECEDHKFEWRNQVEANCGHPGYSGDYICKVCNYVEEAGETIPQWEEHGELKRVNVVRPNCTQKGYTGDLQCTVCKTIVEKGKSVAKKHPATALTTTKEAVPATCTSIGYTAELECTNCDTIVQKQKRIAKLPHDCTYYEKIPATCTKEGQEAYYECKDCKVLLKEDKKTVVRNLSKLVIPALGHNFTKMTSDKNAHWYVCKNTGCTLVKEGSKEIHKPGPAATETTPQLCTVCSYEIASALGHVHNYGKTWVKDSVNHWTVCTCGTKKDIAEHSAGDWVVTVNPTETTEGSKQKACTICGYIIEKAVISALGVTLTAEEKTIADQLGVTPEGAKSIAEYAKNKNIPTTLLLTTQKTICKQKSENVKDATYNLLSAKTTKITKNTITLKWNKIKDADGYIVFGNKCGSKNRYVAIKTLNSKKATFTQKKLKKGQYYKYLVIAYKLIDGKKITIAASKTVHATTIGGKYGNAKSIKVNKTKLSLKKGKTFTIKASEVKEKKKINRHRKIAFESSNKKIATVNSKGKVTAKKKGTCYIYVYAQNGVSKKVKVKVK